MEKAGSSGKTTGQLRWPAGSTPAEDSRIESGSTYPEERAPDGSPEPGIRVAVLIPCFDEEQSIAGVVSDFRRALPQSTIYVYDNNSTDRTGELARHAGAVVRHEAWQGKGHVVRRMFADVDADIYVLVDGDGTYDAGSAGMLVDALLEDGLDMINAARVDDGKPAYRPGHRWGNRALSGLVNSVFGSRITDVLSGYRVISRRFVKSFPALSEGFEIETELTVHALELRMPVAEVPCPYSARPEGSASKLNTVRDGIRIFATILALFREERPMRFFGSAGLLFGLLSSGLGLPVVGEYLQTGLVPRLPTALLATGLMLLAFLSVASGLILDTVTRGRRELKRLHYLGIPLKHSRRQSRRPAP